jgi:ABC-type glycerol-3-phosphate transport system substrate-binding protein
MKKICAAVIAAAALTTLAGCGSDAQKSEVAEITRAQSITTTQAQQSAEMPEYSADELKPLYKAPADFVKIDTTLDDPTTGEMRFLYDGKGRVVCEAYTISEHPVRVDYGYDDTEKKVKIVAFMENRVVDEKSIDLPDYDETVGFADKEGYYFKGYKFE